MRSDDTQTADEGYSLTIDGTGIVVAGKTYRGIAWGTITLVQAIETGNGNPVRLPFLTVNDQPWANYRGLLIDGEDPAKLLDLLGRRHPPPVKKWLNRP